jgi:hypothetical protein
VSGDGEFKRILAAIFRILMGRRNESCNRTRDALGMGHGATQHVRIRAIGIAVIAGHWGARWRVCDTACVT